MKSGRDPRPVPRVVGRTPPNRGFRLGDLRLQSVVSCRRKPSAEGEARGCRRPGGSRRPHRGRARGTGVRHLSVCAHRRVRLGGGRRSPGTRHGGSSSHLLWRDIAEEGCRGQSSLTGMWGGAHEAAHRRAVADGSDQTGVCSEQGSFLHQSIITHYCCSFFANAGVDVIGVNSLMRAGRVRAVAAAWRLPRRKVASQLCRPPAWHSAVRQREGWSLLPVR